MQTLDNHRLHTLLDKPAVRRVLSAPFDRRAWRQRIVLLFLAYAAVGALVGVLALAEWVTRAFGS